MKYFTVDTSTFLHTNDCPALQELARQLEENEFDAQYDEKKDAYYIRTYRLSPFAMGGAYDVIIQSDGTVLAIWGEK